MKYSSTNSPIENSVNNYNQIYMMSIVCREYIAKSFLETERLLLNLKWECLKAFVHYLLPRAL